MFLVDQKSFGLNTPLPPLRGQPTVKLLSQKAAHLRTGSPLWAGEIARFKSGTAGLQSGVITNEPLTLFYLGEENIYLVDFDVKLRKKLLCTLFFF